MTKNKEGKINWKEFGKIAGAVLVIYVLSWLALYFIYGNTTQAGTFGDQFGAVNALFSGLALAGVIYTLIQQQQEMSAQRREFRDEMTLQRREFMNSRAYTLAYKQVELVQNSIEKANKTIHTQRSMHYSTVYDVFSTLNSMIGPQHSLAEKVINQALEGVRGVLPNSLRVLANSCDLLIRLTEDGMLETDTRILFNILRFNTDKEIWDFIANLNSHENGNTAISDANRQSYSESLERINNFTKIYIELKNKNWQ